MAQGSGLRHALEITAAGRTVLVMRPDASPARGSVEMLATLARARARAAAACFLPPEGEAGALVDLATSRDVALVGRNGWRRSWFRARWAGASAIGRARRRWHEATASGRHEMYRELRRHAGNERLPSEYRRRLRERAHRAYERSLATPPGDTSYPRRLLREPSALALPAGALDAARAGAAAAGFIEGRPSVLFDAPLRRDLAVAATQLLEARGYQVLTLPPGAALRLRLFLLCASRFAVCTSRDMQQLAYVTNTPSLTVHATDVFEAYPVRVDGVVLLRAAVDLDTAQEIPIVARLAEGHYRNARNIGYREHSLDDITAALAEMCDGVDQGWRESESQTRFRERATAAAATLAPLVPTVAAWGADDGFLGDGRLARVQADLA